MSEGWRCHVCRILFEPRLQRHQDGDRLRCEVPGCGKIFWAGARGGNKLALYMDLESDPDKEFIDYRLASRK